MSKFKQYLRETLNEVSLHGDVVVVSPANKRKSIFSTDSSVGGETENSEIKYNFKKSDKCPNGCWHVWTDTGWHAIPAWDDSNDTPWVGPIDQISY